MITKFIVTKFVKDYNNVKDFNVRKSYGYVGSIVSIAANFILFIVKLIVGLLTNSIAVIADSFSTLSDAVSSIITLVGFKLSSKFPDEKHPFGYGRVEYISAMIVCFIVMMVGVELIKTSFNRILHPVAVHFDIVLFTLIIISIFVKFWLSRFSKYIAKAINSASIEASSMDAVNDGIASCCVALSLVVSLFIKVPIDGYIGMAVALFILYSGFSLLKNTLSTVLGKAPEPELVEHIIESVLGYEYILGVHDLMVHDYGPGRCIASIHAEVPSDMPMPKMHEVIDKAEQEISKKLGIFLVIHMDPINMNDEDIVKTRQELETILKKFSYIQSMHDFRVVGDSNYKNLIFDIVISHKVKLTAKDEDAVKKDIDMELKKIYPEYNAVITIDRDYIE